MSRPWLRATIGFGAMFAALFAATALFAPQPRLLWNASASVPVGLYRIDTASRPAVGDLVAAAPPATLSALLARRGYLPSGVPLLKRIAAMEGALVCRRGRLVTIDGAAAAAARLRDRAGRPLPGWSGCRRLRRGEIFLLGTAHDSFDSRYFGALPVSALVGVASPLLTRCAAGAPLRWRRACSPLPNSEQGN